jgi:hypothetical protein
MNNVQLALDRNGGVRFRCLATAYAAASSCYYWLVAYDVKTPQAQYHLSSTFELLACQLVYLPSTSRVIVRRGLKAVCESRALVDQDSLRLKADDYRGDTANAQARRHAPVWAIWRDEYNRNDQSENRAAVQSKTASVERMVNTALSSTLLRILASNLVRKVLSSNEASDAAQLLQMVT